MADEGDMDKDRESTPSSSSGSSDSSEEEEIDAEEESLLKKLHTVKEQLLDQPDSYDLLVEKIQILQSLGELKELRSTRAALSKLYPLTPDLWLHWIQDESNLVTDVEGKNSIIDLFERAIKDYQSVKIWLQYIQYMRDMEDENCIANCRVVLERALAAMGLHVTLGHSIWQVYRDFELQLLSTQATAEQKARCSALCFRQLSVPLVGNEQAYENIKATFPIDETTEQNYQKTLQRLKHLEEWEAKLNASSNSVAVYKEYVQFEKQEKSNPARIICLYERAICDNALDSSLWFDYLNYASNELQIGPVVLELATRATRNCSWEVSIWAQFLYEIEKFTQDKDEMRDVFERGLVYCTTGDQAGNLWLKYLQFLRRRINYSMIVEEDVQLFVKTLSAAEEHLNQFFPEPREYIGEILLFAIRFQAHMSKSMTKTRKLWYNALHKGYGQKFKLWIQFFQLEQRYGDPISTRKCLEKAMSVMSESLDIVAELWLNFERDFGDVKSLKHTEEKITEFFNKKYEADAQFVSKSQNKKSRVQKGKGWKPRRPPNQDQGRRDEEFRGRKRKNFGQSESEEPHENKKKKNDNNNGESTEESQPHPSSQHKKNIEQKTIRRPQKSFVPRSLQVQQSKLAKPLPPSTSEGKSTNPSEDGQIFKKPMTNADFRNLLKKPQT